MPDHICSVCSRPLAPNAPAAFLNGRIVCARCQPPAVQYATPPSGSDAIATMIPYKNVPALISYYTGLFSIFPVLGFPLAITALICAVKGLKKAREDPAAKGKVHAIVGLVCGIIGLIINCTCIGGIILGLLSSHS